MLDNISAQLTQIASLDPTSQIGLAVKLLAEQVAKEAKRLHLQRERTRKFRAKTVTVTPVTVTLEPPPDRYRNVTVTSLYTKNIGLTELSKKESIQARSRASRLQEDWRPSEADLNFAKSLGWSDLEISQERDSFVDYWIAVPASKGTKLNWSATWRNRIRDQTKRRSTHLAKPLQPKRRTIHDQARDIDAAFAAQDQPENGNPLAIGTVEIISPGWGNDAREVAGNGGNPFQLSGKHDQPDMQLDNGDGYQF